VHRLDRYRQGPSTFRVDWALSASVPWTSEPAQRSAVVHTGASLESLARSFRQTEADRIPDELCVVVGQPSLVDPSRAPKNQHTLSSSLRVPRWSSAQWEQNREPLANRVEEHIEQLAPGFRRSILGRHVAAPPDHEPGSDALLGGVSTGGSPVWHAGVLRRLLSPGSDYRTPVSGLYLCSSATHPGPGVHGMCGYNAAGVMLRDLS
jgi:phytoene dehydrogenase-like protein